MTPLPPLLVLTDRRGCERRGRTLAETVAAAVGGGARAFVLREKDLSRPQRASWAPALVAVLRPAGGMLVVTSDPGLASELGNGWVHLAEADAPAARVGGGRPGRSCHGAASLARGWREGRRVRHPLPCLTHRSKPGYGPALGLARLAELAAGVRPCRCTPSAGWTRPAPAAVAGPARGGGGHGRGDGRQGTRRRDAGAARRPGGAPGRPGRAPPRLFGSRKRAAGGRSALMCVTVPRVTERDADDRRSIAPSGGPLVPWHPRRGADAEAGRR